MHPTLRLKSGNPNTLLPLPLFLKLRKRGEKNRSRKFRANFAFLIFGKNRNFLLVFANFFTQKAVLFCLGSKNLFWVKNHIGRVFAAAFGTKSKPSTYILT